MTPDEFENQRLSALHRYGLLDTPPEKIFDSITVAIAKICEVPIALISLVDEKRQWFKSAYGLRTRETPRDVAFCSRAIEQSPNLMIVEDASRDHRFSDNPLVTGEPSIRFYAGKPLETQDGFSLGTLCVIDTKPRQLRPHQIAALEALGKTVSSIIEERSRIQEIVVDRFAVEELAHQNAIRFQHLYQDSQAMIVALLQQLKTAALLLDQTGQVICVNEQWSRFSDSHEWPNLRCGQNYLEACEKMPLHTGCHVVADRLFEVLSGSREQLQFACSSVAGGYSVEARCIQQQTPGAIIQHFSEALI